MSKFATEEEKDYLEEGVEKFRNMGLEVHRRLYEDAFSLWEASVENLTQPIFIMAGKDDKIVSIEGTLDLVKEVESSTLLTLKNQEHHIILTRTQLVISLIEQFMEQTEMIMREKYYTDEDLADGKLSVPLISMNSASQESLTN
jgi:pimeloyl-ACP methyl ester carboxylesterase